MKLSDLHDYQKLCVKHIIKNTHCGLFLEMGLGKTVSTLTAINHLMFNELEISKTLVIAPKRVAESVWTSEVKKWDHLKHLKVVRIAGTKKQRNQALQQEADIYTLGRDNVDWICGKYGGSMLPFDMLVLDELSSFKNPKSIRFKALRKVQPSFRRVVGLTGTPSPNGLIDLWSQLYLLDRGERLGKFISEYRRTYFKEGMRNGYTVYNWNIQKGAENSIQEGIKDICISMSAKDYLELPPVIERNISIKFPEKLQKKYNDFEKEQVLELLEGQEEGEEISAVNAAALSNKLLQFANGIIYDEDKKEHVVHKLKLEALKDIIEDMNGKSVLIAWTYRSDRAAILKALRKYKPRELKGEQDIEDWNEGKIQILMTHPASGGHGLNLQLGGNTIIWYGQTWSLELEQQLNARLNRQGQKNKVFIYKLISEKTIDQDVIRAQKRKKYTQNGLMEAIKARIEKYLD